MLSRPLALLLSLLVAASPAAAASRQAVASVQLNATAIQAPIVAINAIALPSIPQAPQLQLQSLSAPDLPAEHAGMRFDGAKLPKAGETSAPLVPATPLASSPSGLQPSAPQPPKDPKQPGFFKRLNRATDTTSKAERFFELGVEAGIALGATLPIALKMTPALSLYVSLPIALASMVGVFGLITLGRAARFIVTRRDPVKAPSSLRRVVLASALGLAVGGGLTAAPKVFERPLTVAVMNAVQPESQTRAIPGRVLRDAVVAELSSNPVGRDVLDGLRDRLGFLHMPAFYIGDTKDAVARYNAPSDSVTFDLTTIRGEGWTVERFLKDPEAQRAFAKRHASVIAHELRHAGQSRRSPFEDGVMKNVMNYEAEYEAYLTEHFYAFEKLKAAPGVQLESEEQGNFLAPLDDLEAFLRMTDGSYPKNVHVKSYDAWLNGLKARWPAHQVEAYDLLARHYELRGVPKMAALYKKAAERARAEIR